MDKLSKWQYLGGTLLAGGGFELLTHSQPGLIIGGTVAFMLFKYGPRELDFNALAARALDEVGINHTIDTKRTVQAIAPAHGSQQLNMSATLQPHINLILSNRIGIFGIAGSGKSNTTAVFIEELAGTGVPLVVFDTENEYWPLCTDEYFVNPAAIDCEKVTAKTASQFGKMVMDNGLQAVVNLQSYEEDEAALVMVGILQGIQEWQESLQVDDRVPCTIILDEAAQWLPQRTTESTLKKDTLEKLQQTFFKGLVRRGRKRGMGFVFATQRPAELDKRAISCQWLILHRHTQPADLKAYSDMGIDSDVAMALANGEAMVVSPTQKTQPHQIRERKSPDGGFSPGYEQLQKYNSRERKRFTSSLLRMPDLPMREPVEKNTDELEMPLVDENLREAYDAWQDGATSVAKLKNALGITHYQAYQLYQKLQAEGLVEAE